MTKPARCKPRGPVVEFEDHGIRYLCCTVCRLNGAGTMGRWCDHVELWVTSDDDAPLRPGPHLVPIQPSEDFWVTVEVLPSDGKGYEVTLDLRVDERFPVPRRSEETLYLGTIYPSEGRRAIREAFVEFLRFWGSRDVACLSSAHPILKRRLLEAPKDVWAYHISGMCSDCLARCDYGEDVPVL